MQDSHWFFLSLAVWCFFYEEDQQIQRPLLVVRPATTRSAYAELESGLAKIRISPHSGLALIRKARLEYGVRSDLQRVSDIFFIAFCIWREGRAEPREGKIAIGYTILNRADHPKWWGNSIDTVIVKPWQYSSFTDPKDVQLTKYPVSGTVWEECLDVATQVYLRAVPNPVPEADSYYATWMDEKGQTPKWADPKKFVKQVGNHKFYNLDGSHPENIKVAA